LAKELGAHEIVAPDIKGDAKKTIRKSNELCRYLEDKGLLNDFNLMVVPQGRTLEEVLNCIVTLFRLPAKVVGIPARILPAKTSYRSEQLRFSVIQQLAQQKLLRSRQVHLLGLCGVQFLKAYRKGKRFFRIRSIDTSFPIILGALGKTFEQTKRKPSMALDYDLNFTKQTIERVKTNIKYLKAYK